jgi:hypothetical protein
MKNARVLMFYAVTAISACHGDATAPSAGQPSSHAAAPVIVKKGPSVAQQTAGMVEASAQGKSTTQVELKFELAQKPQVGKALDVNLAILPQIDASTAQIQITGTDGLDLAAGSKQFDLPGVEAGGVYRQSVKVTPNSDGVLVLGLTISLKHDEITDSRVFSIPLIVDR